MCHSLPRQKLEVGAWVTFPGGGGIGGGASRCWERKAPRYQHGLLCFGTCYIPGPVLGAQHVRSLMTSTTLQRR